MVEGFTRGIIRWKFFDAETTSTIMGFFPLDAISNVLKEPFSRLNAVQSVANQIGENVSLDYQTTLLEIALVLLWSAIFIWGSFKIVQKRDL
jgi:hypothetical protein